MINMPSAKYFLGENGLPYIHRESQLSLFKKIKKSVISRILFEFLKEEDIVEAGKVNIVLRNCVSDYFSFIRSDINTTLKYLEKKYNLEMDNNYEYQSFEDFLGKKLFKIKNIEENIVKFKNNLYPIFYGLFNKVEWSWVNNPSYYTKVLYPNSILGKTRKLSAVCWLNCEISLHNIPKGNYSLSIRHRFDGLDEKELQLKVSVENSQVFYMEYPSSEFLNKNRNYDNTLFDSYLCNINKNQFNNDKCNIVVNIDHFDGTAWKYGWSIDALILEKI